MTKKELFYFTGQCLTLDEHPGFREEIIALIAKDAIDWEKLIGLCSNHLVLPLIYLKFKTHGLLSSLPEEVLECLEEIHALNFSRNQQILQQVKEVTALLNKEGIYPVYLKGAGHLINGLYTDIGERMIGDIDLLVSEKDYLPAARLLEKEGYSTGGTFYGDVNILKHYPRLFKPGVPADLEVHRMPVAEKHESWFNAELIFKEKKTVSGLEGCFVLSDKHNLIHNFIHCQLGHQGHNTGIVAFRDLYDLYLFSKRTTIESVLAEIKPRQKAIAYFVLAAKALGLAGEFYPSPNLSSRILILKHDLNYSSKIFYNTYRAVNYIFQRINGYIRQFIQSFYSKKVRRSVIDRLSNRQWYMAHLKSYKNIFQR